MRDEHKKAIEEAENDRRTSQAANKPRWDRTRNRLPGTFYDWDKYSQPDASTETDPAD